MKFLLDQRLSTIPQLQWVSNLFGFDFTVEFRPGRLNIVADALSRRDADAASSPSSRTYGVRSTLHPS
uniref:Reverse transcriptase RNase H-like domain-containing protein n=1 Tax=Aegilops tauschii subsp. strangulata TaxID=200361 RepID=A0A452Y8M4_AEGTS